MNKLVTWILIADGSRARIFKAAGRERIEEKHDMAVPHPPTGDLVTDRPGRTFDSAGPGRHAMEPPTDAHEKAETDFLRAVSKELDAAFQRKEFERLIVVAEPRALGKLRQMFPGRLADAVAKEVRHDLTSLTTPELDTYLREQEII